MMSFIEKTNPVNFYEVFKSGSLCMAPVFENHKALI